MTGYYVQPQRLGSCSKGAGCHLETIDLIQVVSGSSPVMAFGLVCLWLLNRQYQDALRREREYAESQRADRKEALAAQQNLMAEMTEVRMELITLKNAIYNSGHSPEGDRRWGSNRQGQS
jgi:hypothetical protein